MSTDANELSPLKRAFLAVQTLQGKVAELELARSEPIAIVGMSCRLPRAANIAAYWELLRNGVDAISPSPDERWKHDPASKVADAEPDSIRWGGFLDAVDTFDPQFFGIAPREAAGMDPQQRMFLEGCWEALEDAGIAPDRLKGSATGVFAGIATGDFATMQTRSGELDTVGMHYASGIAHSIVAGRVSYLLGLNGPCISLDTACSSSLVAIHLACQSLRNGEADLAVAGGVNAIVLPDNAIAFSRTSMLASDGRCKAFDARADGFVRGEGCGVIALKRLSKAIADGDLIHAVIRGSAINQDGASSGMTAPSGPAQEAVIRSALRAANLRPRDVNWVEAHGTGTSLGDPIEVQAIGAALGDDRAADQPVLIGSVKSNLGHLEAAAGVAGLIKIILALKHEAIPPSLHFETPNPFIPWERLPVAVNTTLTPWQRSADRLRVAGVSSFGFSGTNAHIVVSEAPTATPKAPNQADRPRHVLAWSAPTETAVRAIAGEYASHVAAHPEQALADVAHGANVGRSHFRHRAAMTFVPGDDVAARLREFAATGAASHVSAGQMQSSDAPRVVFLFTGQGSQYPGMGKHLYESQPTFRRAIDACDAIVGDTLSPRLVDVLFPREGATSPIHDTEFTQPALFALEYAMAALWQSWGVKPAAVIGHSLGEIVAATVAGVLQLEDALRLVVVRGRLGQRALANGAMASVTAAPPVVAAILDRVGGGVSIAALNGPEATVISGPQDAVAAAVDAIRADGINVKLLASSSAFHSAAADAMLPAFGAAASKISYATQRIPIYSNLYGRRATAGEMSNADYWVRHVREPVRFGESFAAVVAEGLTTFLEVGPHTTLLGLGRQCAPETAAAWLPSLRREHDEWTILLGSLAQLYVRGVSIDWAAFDRDYARQRVRLPTYPFERQRYWTAPAKVSSRQRAQSLHPLLGRRIASPFVADRVFETELSLDAIPWLGDHRALGSAVLPTTAYLEAAWSAARILHGDSVDAIEDFEIFEALVTPEEGVATMQLGLAPQQGGSASFRVVSSTASTEDASAVWRSHAAGVIALKPEGTTGRADAPVLDLVAIDGRCTASFAPDELRDAVRERGIVLGARFEALRQIATGESEAIGFAELSDEMAADMKGYGVHPALLDAALQVASAALVRDPMLGNSDDTYMPVAIERFRLFAPIGRQLRSHVVIRKLAKSTMPIADLMIYDAEGALAAEIIGLRLKRVENASWAARGADVIGDQLYQVQWKRVDAPTAVQASGGGGGTWILLADATGLASDLAAELERTGDRVVIVRPSTEYSSTNVGFNIPADDQSAFSRVIDEVVGAGASLAGLVHGWSLDAVPADGAAVAELHAAEALGVRSALHLVQAAATSNAAASSRLVLLTRGAQAVAGDDVSVPLHATVWGLGATTRLEHPDLQCVTIDLDAVGPRSIGELVARLRSSDEQQLAIRQHEWFAPRLARVERTPVDESSVDGTASVKLVNTTPGVLDGLTFVDDPRRAPGPHEVEIAVEISALNFRDVLVAMALYPGASASDQIGGECAGTIVAVGDAVSRFAVGDAVIAMAPGALGTHTITHEELVLPVPPGFTIEQAVTLPTVFLTTWHSLYDLAHLKAGERVLIHAGAGGIGLSAIQLAKRVGAEIFATAGSPAKRAFLESLGVHHVMDSRSLAYADQIMALTGGAGVDVVLNSLTDDHITRSFGLLSDGGRFVELGKRGIWSQEQARAAHPGVRYFVVDLLATSYEQPETIGAVMREVYAAAAAGEITPLPSTTFASTEVSAAFRYMAQARHIGKILVTRKRTVSGVSIRPDGTYLVTGGLGGLGLVTAEWLMERGAGHVVLMGRRAPDDEARETIDRLNAERSRVSVFLGDIGSEDGVRGVLDDIARQHPPLRGIVHAAGVLNDGVIVGKSWDAFAATLGPKVDGTWHLHRHTHDLALDFFVLYSSISALFGSPGQANHAAANAFLDAFAHYRRARGLPASSINWGAWRDVGVAVKHDVATRIGAQGMGTISPADGMKALERLLDGGSVQAAVMPVDWSRFAKQFGGGHLRSTLMADLANAAAASASGTAHKTTVSSPAVAPSVEDLRNAPVATRWTSLLQRMKQITAQVLGLEPSQPVDEYRPLQELGLDSLMAVELRNLMKAAFALERAVPATVVFDYPNVNALTEFIGTGVFGWTTARAESSAATVVDDGDDMDMLDRLTTLSADEVDALLAKRMGDGA